MEFYDSHNNFLGIEESEYSLYLSSKVVLQLLPYEYTSTYLKGSKNGPQAILSASHYVEFYDEELTSNTYRKLGIATQQALDFGNLVDENAIELIRSNTAEHIKNNKFVMSFGAEHTVTYGVFKAFHEKHPNVSILQLDAHSDLRQSYKGNRYSHASVMARVNDLGVKISQVGVRAQCEEEAQLIDDSSTIQTIYAHQLQSSSSYISEILEHLTDDVYITIDADGLDPSIVPAVGTPEPGGLTYYQTLDLLKAICKNKRVMGFDIVECSPIAGQIRSEYLLAKLAYKVLGYCSLNSKNFAV